MDKCSKWSRTDANASTYRYRRQYYIRFIFWPGVIRCGYMRAARRRQQCQLRGQECYWKSRKVTVILHSRFLLRSGFKAGAREGDLLLVSDFRPPPTRAHGTEYTLVACSNSSTEGAALLVPFSRLSGLPSTHPALKILALLDVLVSRPCG